jgi:peptidoglycan/LPS O-acetylase OafA/YrhL
VLWHHALPRWESGWVGRGHVGVRLFFALSGFLISTRLLAERRATGNVRLGHFWLRRSLRIFPLYYAVLGLFALYLAVRAGDAGSRHFFQNLLFHASYTSNWFVDYTVSHPVWFAFGWSLATEEQFYAWWPPVLRSRQLTGAALALLGVLLLQQLAVYGALDPWLAGRASVQRVLVSFAPALSLGALLALALEGRSSFAALWALCGRWHTLTAALPALLLGLLLATGQGAPLLLDLAFALLVASVVLPPQTWLARALSVRPLRELGRISYGIYLFHVPVLGALRRLWPGLGEHPGLLLPLGLGLSAGAAAVSHRYFEAPLLRLARARAPSASHGLSVTVDPSGAGPVLAWSPTDSRRLDT